MPSQIEICLTISCYKNLLHTLNVFRDVVLSEWNREFSVTSSELLSIQCGRYLLFPFFFKSKFWNIIRSKFVFRIRIKNHGLMKNKREKKIHSMQVPRVLYYVIHVMVKGSFTGFNLNVCTVRNFQSWPEQDEIYLGLSQNKSWNFLLSEFIFSHIYSYDGPWKKN